MMSPIIDMFLFLYDQYEQGYVTLMMKWIKPGMSSYDTLHDATQQLPGRGLQPL